ncbi:Eco29kI family restriction endonuclease [Actinomadura sp. NAK00032]|uniref:Eco29kI family restriction endonuclease n=1 Tax=Actinomadura sp. NAK00032 TaxID=2742128 RepID=UPI001590FFA2|nr:Eco29kI family restriction endonuclease [Actinomadura sp. NAK00032]QKW33292.1 Eco29kI family restriction endonuclease [Actinomadura sp. NAK00032]
MTSEQEQPEPYNPLDDENLARNVADALEAEPARAFPHADTRWAENRVPTSAGLYALYYVGSAAPYAPLGELTRRSASVEDNDVGPHAIPIYVGRALAGATRRGHAPNEGGIRRRLQEHRSSIRKATSTLDLADFRYRYLVVKDIWVPLGEYGLLRRYTPLWNNVLDGFGIHGPGGGRGKQARSRWDTLHPGRTFGNYLPPHVDSVDQITARIAQALDATLHHQVIPSELLVTEPPETPTLPEA